MCLGIKNYRHQKRVRIKKKTPIYCLIFLLLFSKDTLSIRTQASSFSDGKKSYLYIQNFPIEGYGFIAISKMERFILQKNPSLDKKFLHYILKTYMRESTIESINYEIAIAQMLLETGFLKFGSSVEAYQNNFAGLGSISQNHKGVSFPFIFIGIRAHIQHLKAYASSRQLVYPLVDPRFHLVKRNSAKNMKSIAKFWASDPLYAEKWSNMMYGMHHVR